MSFVGLLDLVNDPKSDIVDGPFGSNMKSSDYVDSGIPVIKLQNVKSNQFLEKNIDYLTKKKATELQRHSYKAGDIVITKLGDPLGVSCIMPKGFPDGIIVADLIRVRPNREFIDPRFLCYQLNSPAVANQFKELTKGTTRPRVNLTLVREIKVWKPELATQKKVVAKIDSLFAEIDAGTEELKQTKAKLELYKQSVLNSAIQGKLVPQDPNDEPASKLLERIRAEKSKLVKEGKIKQILLIAKTSEEEFPFKIPNNWTIARGFDVFEFVTSGSRGWGKYRGDKGALFLGMGNLDHGSLDIDFTKVERVQLPKGVEGARTLLKKEDILISITADVGMVGVVQNEIEEAYINQHVALARPIGPQFSSLYLGYYLNSSFGLKGLKLMQRGATKVGLGLDDIRETVFPIPPKDEQKRIVRNLQKAIAEIQSTSDDVERKFSKIFSIRQSILKSAFEGKLV